MVAGVKHDVVTGYSVHVHIEPGLERSQAWVLFYHISELVPDTSRAVVWIHLLEYDILDFDVPMIVVNLDNAGWMILAEDI